VGTWWWVLAVAHTVRLLGPDPFNDTDSHRATSWVLSYCEDPLGAVRSTMGILVGPRGTID
jgi:hypothetical protein